jgi:hypothetical protein
MNIIKYKNKLLFTLTILFTLLFNLNKSYAVNVTPTSYINKIYSVMLCGPGSSLTSCESPVILGSETDGKSFDLSSVTAGASAGGIGSLATVPYGTTYSFFQVILDRQFTVTAEGHDGTRICVTAPASGDGTASNNTTPALGTPKTSDTTASDNALAQVIKIPNGFTLDTNMNGTDVIDGSVSANEEPPGDAIDADTPFIKFRVALATPFTLKPGKMPNVQVAFSLANAVNFANTGGGTCLVSPNAPAVAITFVE